MGVPLIKTYSRIISLVLCRMFAVGANNHGISICTLSGLNTSSCKVSSSGNSFSAAISSDKSVAYIVVNSNTIDSCIISGYSLTNCTSNSLQSGETVYLNGSTLYTSYGFGKGLQVCLVNGTNINNCSKASLNFQPVGIAVVGDTIFMVHNSASPNNNVTACTIAGNVTSNCVSTQLLDDYPWGIAIYNSTAFITSTSSNKLTVCTVVGQNLTNCAHTTYAVPSYHGYGIHIHDSIAYIAGVEYISGCPISGRNITSCTQVLTGLIGVFDFAIA